MRYMFTVIFFIQLFMMQVISQNRSVAVSSIKTIKLNKEFNEGEKNYDETKKSTSILFKKDKSIADLNTSNNLNSRTIRNETKLDNGNLLSESIFQVWNGTIWNNSRRDICLYDVRNNKVKFIRQRWLNDVWTADTRELYNYDSNNNLIRFINQYWSDSVWINDYKYSALYDVNNNMVEILELRWYDSVWVNVSKESSIYDINNNLIETLYQEWDCLDWVNEYKILLTYDSNNKLLQETGQLWNGAVWINDYKGLLTYNTNDNLIERIFFNWSTSEWVNYILESYLYDINNNCVQTLYYLWIDSIWVNDFRSFSTFDEHNNIIEIIDQDWYDSVWVNYYRYLYTYDVDNNLIESVVQFSFDKITWDDISKYLYYYSLPTSLEIISPNGGENLLVGSTTNISWTSNNLSTLKIRYSTNNGTNWNNIAFVNADSGSYDWIVPNTISSHCIVLIGDSSEALVYDESDSVFSIITSTSIFQEESDLVPREFVLYQNYPNPFNPGTKISWQSPIGSWQTLKVFDVLGNEVATLVNEYREAGNYEIDFDASALPSGVYFYRMRAVDFNQSKKMLLLK